MKDRKLLVIFHIYYHEHVDYYLDKIKNINGCEWDLLVTYVAYSSETEQKVRAIKPNASFFEVDNLTDAYEKITKNIDGYVRRFNAARQKGEI